MRLSYASQHALSLLLMAAAFIAAIPPFPSIEVQSTSLLKIAPALIFYCTHKILQMRMARASLFPCLMEVFIFLVFLVILNLRLR